MLIIFEWFPLAKHFIPNLLKELASDGLGLRWARYIIELFFFEGLYSQKNKNFTIKNKENEISHGRVTVL